MAIISRTCQLITHLQLFSRKDTVIKQMSLIDEPVHVAVRMQLLEMSSIMTLNQTISNVCTRSIFQGVLFVRKNIGDFSNLQMMKKFSTMNVCKQDNFDF